ncbi:MAG: hypothetical protein XD92_0278 [Proteiniphilum acetatigenes]|jgi:hypothetical protein|uniref:Uncharacterized protein n=1 Tax=Proteiniphilum acetatigenes TaxID=294710 RepID=A0A101HKF4_9BACT|nr:MAG: hypothetical protein XD92_0278 [Proteiniphilum acetatigenes]
MPVTQMIKNTHLGKGDKQFIPEILPLILSIRCK